MKDIHGNLAASVGIFGVAIGGGESFIIPRVGAGGIPMSEFVNTIQAIKTEVVAQQQRKVHIATLTTELGADGKALDEQNKANGKSRSERLADLKNTQRTQQAAAKEMMDSYGADISAEDIVKVSKYL